MPAAKSKSLTITGLWKWSEPSEGFTMIIITVMVEWVVKTIYVYLHTGSKPQHSQARVRDRDEMEKEPELHLTSRHIPTNSSALVN